jgi:CO/xanthine dehydrogenase Mo-binding subunit
MSEYKVVGQSEIRIDAVEKITGKAIYTGDINLPDLHYGSIVRSPFPHARLIKIDKEKALAIEGVIAVVTVDDIPGSRIVAPLIQDRPVLAYDKVRLVGEPVAVVIATSRQAAENGRNAVKVTYEELPYVYDPLEALEPGAPAIHPGGNLLSHIEVCDGDIEVGFQKADFIFEETYHVPRAYPGYLEPESSVSQRLPDNTIKIWASTQKPFNDRTLISQALGIDEQKVTVIVPAIGGAFGGKEDSSLHMLAALAAWTTRKPVKLVNSREESILAHPKRHAGQLQYKVGVNKTGELTALQCTVHLDTGAYASYGPAVGQLLTESVTGPYRVPNVKADTYVVYTNGPIAGAMRGFGSPQTNFCYESLMDEIAVRLELDPAELRRRNIWHPGDYSFTRVPVNQAEAIQQSLDIAVCERDRLRKIKTPSGKIAGVGFALGMQTMGLGFRVPDDSANRLEWLPDGRVRLHIGAPDLGQGLLTAAAQIVAESLELPFSAITITNLDTSQSPDGGVSCASRMTYLVGNSVIKASHQAIETLVQSAAQLLGVKPTDLSYHQGMLHRLDKPDTPPIAVAEITCRLAEEGSSIQATGIFSFPFSPDTPDHLPVGMPHNMFCFGAQVARVEVDPELGTIEVKEIVAIQDVGKIINKAAVEGQIEGGISMGLGYALCEEMQRKPNGDWVDNLTDYLLPTILDMPPQITTILLENKEESGPFGAKGVGEMGVIPVAAAIANAIYDATGIRAKTIPVRSEMLLKLF